MFIYYLLYYPGDTVLSISFYHYRDLTPTSDYLIIF